MGYEMMFKGDMESAEKLLKKNVELFPESYNVYDSYAEVQMKLGNYDEAKKNFQKTLELNPWSDYSKAMLDSLNSGGSPAPSGGSLKYFMPHSTAHFLHEHNHDHK
jgi:tetratricopeptide (TPR) repeat protein